MLDLLKGYWNHDYEKLKTNWLWTNSKFTFLQEVHALAKLAVIMEDAKMFCGYERVLDGCKCTTKRFLGCSGCFYQLAYVKKANPFVCSLDVSTNLYEILFIRFYPKAIAHLSSTCRAIWSMIYVWYVSVWSHMINLLQTFLAPLLKEKKKYR